MRFVDRPWARAEPAVIALVDDLDPPGVQLTRRDEHRPGARAGRGHWRPSGGVQQGAVTYASRDGRAVEAWSVALGRGWAVAVGRGRAGLGAVEAQLAATIVLEDPTAPTTGSIGRAQLLASLLGAHSDAALAGTAGAPSRCDAGDARWIDEVTAGLGFGARPRSGAP